MRKPSANGNVLHKLAYWRETDLYYGGDGIAYWMEYHLDEWFQKNYRKLGISKIVAKNSPGDYLILMNGKWLIAELEKTTWQFFLHQKRIRDQIDVVICFQRKEHGCFDAELNDKIVIEVESIILNEIRSETRRLEKEKEADQIWQ